MVKNEYLKISNKTYFEKEIINMHQIKDQTIINSEPVHIYTINSELANTMTQLTLLKIENRTKKVKIDTTIEDEGDLFEEEAKAEVKRNDIPLEDEEGVP